MTTKLEKILELLNLNFQNGRINEKDFETLRWLIILYEDYINRIEIEDIHNFTIGLVELKRIGYDKKDISTILIWILNLGIKEIGKILFEVSTYNIILLWICFLMKFIILSLSNILSL